MLLDAFIGIGLRHPHYATFLETKPAIAWLEVHSENFFTGGGAALDTLLKIRQDYPISLHGVGLSLGSADGVDPAHLKRLKHLIHLIDPILVSEHLSWNKSAAMQLPDLLPIPYTKQAADVITQNIQVTQDFLDREILIENPSSYLEYQVSEQREVDFLVNACQISGAKLLLDVNNVFVSSYNHGWDCHAYIDAIPAGLVKEIHVAGHTLQAIDAEKFIRVDTHDSPVCDAVWALYDYTIKTLGSVPTLLERDANIPSLSSLISEAFKAKPYLKKHQSALCPN